MPVEPEPATSRPKIAAITLNGAAGNLRVIPDQRSGTCPMCHGRAAGHSAKVPATSPADHPKGTAVTTTSYKPIPVTEPQETPAHRGVAVRVARWSARHRWWALLLWISTV